MVLLSEANFKRISGSNFQIKP